MSGGNVYLDENTQLIGDHFICNIAEKDVSPSGLVFMVRDPRKARLKPKAYVGIVEKIGSGCRTVQVGDRVVIERWIYAQPDVDDERIVARERELLIINDTTPSPYVIVMKSRSTASRISPLIIPDKPYAEEETTLIGDVIASAYPGIVPGMTIIFKYQDFGQFSYGDGRIAIRGKSHLLEAIAVPIGKTVEFEVVN